MLMQCVIYPIFRAKNETIIARPELKDVLKKGLRSHRVVLIYFCDSVLCRYQRNCFGRCNPSCLGDIIVFSLISSPVNLIGQIQSVIY